MLTMLTGPELIAKVTELCAASDGKMADVVRACGYVSRKENGGERVNFRAFHEALLRAKGIDLERPKGKPGRKPGFVATVQGNGNLLIGKVYTEKLGLRPGDQFEIKLGRKAIKLAPVGMPNED